MKRLIYTRKGFTVIEFLIASTIMVLVTGGIMAIFLMSMNTWKEGSAQLVLQRKASMVMEKIVRGVDGENGVREAGSISIPSSDTIRYTSGIDGTERSFYLSTSDLMYDPDTSTAADEYSIADKIDGLTFSISGSMVTINLSMQDTVRDTTIDVDFTTNVKLRN